MLSKNYVNVPHEIENEFLKLFGSYCTFQQGIAPRTVPTKNQSRASDMTVKSYFKDGKLPITAWRREREQLEQEYKDIQTELSPLHADAKRLWAIHYNIYEVRHEQERQNAATRQKKQESEH